MRILKTFCALLVGGSLMMGCTWHYVRPERDPHYYRHDNDHEHHHNNWHHDNGGHDRSR